MSLLCSWLRAVATLHTPTSMLSRGNEAGNSWLIVAEEGKDKGAAEERRARIKEQRRGGQG